MQEVNAPIFEEQNLEQLADLKKHRDMHDGVHQDSHIYLHPSFRQVAAQCQLLARVNIRIVSLLKNTLHLLQLKGREGCSVSTLLTLWRRNRCFHSPSPYTTEGLGESCVEPPTGGENFPVMRAVIGTQLTKHY